MCVCTRAHSIKENNWKENGSIIILGVEFIFIFILISANYRTPLLLTQYKNENPVLSAGVHVLYSLTVMILYTVSTRGSQVLHLKVCRMPTEISIFKKSSLWILQILLVDFEFEIKTRLSEYFEVTDNWRHFFEPLESFFREARWTVWIFWIISPYLSPRSAILLHQVFCSYMQGISVGVKLILPLKCWKIQERGEGPHENKILCLDNEVCKCIMMYRCLLPDIFLPFVSVYLTAVKVQ